jgi:hypothetical protein
MGNFINIETFEASKNIVWIGYAALVTALMTYLLCRGLRKHVADNTSDGNLCRHPLKVFRYICKCDDDSHLLMLGIGLVSLGSCLHRGVWTLWRMLRNYGFTDTALFIQDNAWWLTTPGFITIVAGYMMHLRIAATIIDERWWWAILLIPAFVLFSAAYLITQ